MRKIILYLKIIITYRVIRFFNKRRLLNIIKQRKLLIETFKKIFFFKQLQNETLKFKIKFKTYIDLITLIKLKRKVKRKTITIYNKQLIKKCSIFSKIAKF